MLGWPSTKTWELQNTGNKASRESTPREKVAQGEGRLIKETEVQQAGALLWGHLGL